MPEAVKCEHTTGDQLSWALSQTSEEKLGTKTCG